jgi:hypothetical protein
MPYLLFGSISVCSPGRAPSSLLPWNARRRCSNSPKYCKQMYEQCLPITLHTHTHTHTHTHILRGSQQYSVCYAASCKLSSLAWAGLFVLQLSMILLWPWKCDLVTSSCSKTVPITFPISDQKLSTNIAKRSFKDVAKFKHLGTTLTDQNCMHEEINSGINSGNACYHSVQSLLSSRLLYRKIRLKYIKP